MELPVAIPFTSFTAEMAETLFYDYPKAVFFVGTRWPGQHMMRLGLDDVVMMYGPTVVSKAICGEELSSASRLRQNIVRCVSRVRIS
jgi:hypothetical protein